MGAVVTERGEWLSKGEDNIPKLGVRLLCPLTALHVGERNRNEHGSSACGLHFDAKGSTEALFDSTYTPKFGRPAVVIHQAICVDAAVRECVTVLCFVVPCLSADISCL